MIIIIEDLYLVHIPPKWERYNNTSNTHTHTYIGMQSTVTNIL